MIPFIAPHQWRVMVVIVVLLIPARIGWSWSPFEVSSSPRTPLASIEVKRFIDRIAIPGARWTAVEVIQVHGVAFHFSQFSARGELDAVLAALTGDDLPFERVLFGSRQVLLSGWVNDAHWLLQLSIANKAVEGLLSVLPFDPKAQGAPASLQHDLIADDWAGAYSRLGKASLKEQP